MRNISIRTLAFQHISVMLVSVLTITFFSFFLLFVELYEQQQEEYGHKTKLIAENISQLIFFYNEITHDLAKQEEVIELIIQNDAEKALLWSARTRSLLPYSNGLSLLTGEREVMGDAKQQKIGPLCLDDLILKAEGNLKVIPPIHYPVGKTSHFDIVTPVYQGKNVIGVLFSSFSLQIIQNTLKRLQQNDEYLFVTTEQQLEVASVGKPNPEYKQSITKIAGTNWVLQSEIPDFKLTDFLITYIPTVLIILLIIIVVTILFAMRVGKIIFHDFSGIKQALIDVHQGDYLPARQRVALLKESDEIVSQISELANNIYTYQQKLLTLSFKDELTNLHNRRILFEEYKSYQAMIKRGGTCTLLLFDLDHFKLCNDRFGDSFGDEVLQSFARVLQNNIRGYDSCARLGGDEFIVILADCSRTEIENRYHAINTELISYNKTWQQQYADLIPVTMSVGSITVTNADMTIEQVIKRADKALYSAKDSGRGRICFYSEK